MDAQLFVAALSRPSRLADDPRSPAVDGQRPPYRQWPRLPGAAGRPWRSQGRAQSQQGPQACVDPPQCHHSPAQQRDWQQGRPQRGRCRQCPGGQQKWRQVTGAVICPD